MSEDRITPEDILKQLDSLLQSNDEPKRKAEKPVAEPIEEVAEEIAKEPVAEIIEETKPEQSVDEFVADILKKIEGNPAVEEPKAVEEPIAEDSGNDILNFEIAEESSFDVSEVKNLITGEAPSEEAEAETTTEEPEITEEVSEEIIAEETEPTAVETAEDISDEEAGEEEEELTEEEMESELKKYIEEIGIIEEETIGKNTKMTKKEAKAQAKQDAKNAKIEAKQQKKQDKKSGETAVVDEVTQEQEANAKPADKKKKGDWIYTVLIIICVGVFGVSAYFLGSWMYTNYRSAKVFDAAKNAANISSETVSTSSGDVIAGMEGDGKDGYLKFLDLNMDELYAINSDTVGWIRVNGTLVDYPVVQSSNNDYYLYRDFEENSNSAGCPFVDYRNNGTDITANKNYIIYGHARKDRSMFGSLDYCRQSWWCSDPSFRYIRYNTLEQKTVWKVFSVYTINVTDFNYIETEFATDEAFQSFLNTVSGLSIYNFGESVTSSDTIMTLSTCAYDGHDRLVVHAKLVQIEDINTTATEEN